MSTLSALLRQACQAITHKKNVYRAYLEGELPLRRLAVQKGVGGVVGQIPRVVYQTWIDQSLGKTHLAQCDQFRQLNPEFDFVLYSDAEALAWMEQHFAEHLILDIYKRAKFGPLKTDIWRYCILYKCGGVYFDINKGCALPLRTWVGETTTGLITFERNFSKVLPDPSLVSKLHAPIRLVVNWGLAFKAGHPLLARLIDNICAYYPLFKNEVFDSPKEAILRLTGPEMLTQTLHEWLAVVTQEQDTSWLDSFVQAGIDFEGAGIYDMPGSDIRYLSMPTYAAAKNSTLFELEP